MVLFNYSTKELTAKIVYYGPGLCGKTTNLQWVHEKIPIKNKGKMLSLATEADRTLFFDFLPIDLGTIRGMKTRVQLYTVPGQVFYNATRRMVLKGADCVVFVADSQEAMLDANLGALDNLRENLEANEIDPDQIPTVIQYNKRDLPNALPVDVLHQKLNPKGWPHYEAVAMKGQGVEETLKGATALVFKTLSTKYGPAPARPKPPAPRPPAPPPPPAPESPPLELEPPPLDLGTSPPQPVTPSADALLDSLESPSEPAEPELELDSLEPEAEPELNLDASPEPEAEPELNLDASPEPEAEPELDLDASPEPEAEPELNLDASPELEAEPELNLDALPGPEAEPELSLDASPEPESGSEFDLGDALAEPELTLDAEPGAEDTEPELDLDSTEPPSTAQESGMDLPPAFTLPPAGGPPQGAATPGVVSLEGPASVQGGEIVIPVRLDLGEGMAPVQARLRLTLKLELEK